MKDFVKKACSNSLAYNFPSTNLSASDLHPFESAASVLLYNDIQVSYFWYLAEAMSVEFQT